MSKKIPFEEWVAFPKQLAQRCNSLDGVDILIYAHMFDEYRFYTEDLKRSEYRPSLAGIACNTAFTQKIVRARLKKLISAGLVVQEAPATNRAGASYTVKDYRQLPELLTEPSNKEQREAHQSAQEAPQATISPLDDVVYTLAEKTPPEAVQEEFEAYFNFMRGRDMPVQEKYIQMIQQSLEHGTLSIDEFRHYAAIGESKQ